MNNVECEKTAVTILIEQTIIFGWRLILMLHHQIKKQLGTYVVIHRDSRYSCVWYRLANKEHSTESCSQRFLVYVQASAVFEHGVHGLQPKLNNSRQANQQVHCCWRRESTFEFKRYFELPSINYIHIACCKLDDINSLKQPSVLFLLLNWIGKRCQQQSSLCSNVN